ncbi:Major Facilitator superfamily [Musa troglodytarum]|uniref:Molybdate-anion transporter n=1 Tax=Musa troglodytarum TaxID=320322 RepID=A0A9E7H9G0_9LILI|nr:Major Facilitator superfamily [Musa troglodytarum]
MEAFYWLLFGGLAAVVAALEMSKTNRTGPPPPPPSTRSRTTTSSSIPHDGCVHPTARAPPPHPTLFSRSLISSFFLTLCRSDLFRSSGDWLQGPYVYYLYSQYGYGKGDIGRLFIAGFGSSMLFGTIVGSLADKQFVAGQIVTKFPTSSPEYLSMDLYNFVALSFALHKSLRGFEPQWLSITFSKAIFLGNGLVAIIAGLFANLLTDNLGFGPVAPFDAAACFLAIGMAIILSTWTENYGDPSESKNLVTQFKVAASAISSGSMYTFVFLWTPALSPNDEDIPHGFIFATFMLSSMLGSSIASRLLSRAAPKVESYMQLVFAIAAVTLLLPVITSFLVAPSTVKGGSISFGGCIQLFGFCIFEACVGIFWPSIMKMRSQYIPEEARSTIMNFFRIPLNIFVCVVLYNVDSTGYAVMRWRTLEMQELHIENAVEKMGYVYRQAKRKANNKHTTLIHLCIQMIPAVHPPQSIGHDRCNRDERRDPTQFGSVNLIRCVYVGGSKVVHFTRKKDTSDSINSSGSSSLSSGVPSVCPTFPDCGFHQPNSGVILSCLDCFLGNGSLYCFKYGVPPSVFLAKVRGGTCTTAESDPPEMVINRAMYLLQNGFGNYDVFENNCEDFALYCKTGLLSLEELGIGRSGQASSFFGVPLAALFSTPFKLLAAGPVGMATVTAGMYCAGRYITDIGVRKDVVKVAVGFGCKPRMAPPLPQRKSSRKGLHLNAWKHRASQNELGCKRKRCSANSQVLCRGGGSLVLGLEFLAIGGLETRECGDLLDGVDHAFDSTDTSMRREAAVMRGSVSTMSEVASCGREPRAFWSSSAVFFISSTK